MLPINNQTSAFTQYQPNYMESLNQKLKGQGSFAMQSPNNVIGFENQSNVSNPSAGMQKGMNTQNNSVGLNGLMPANTNMNTGTTDAQQGSTGTGELGGTTGKGSVLPTECTTCTNRKYQDISTDAGVSFKAPANIDPSVAAATVMSHEMEHVNAAEDRAKETNSKVISRITIHTSICPECGRVYVSGGKTHTTTLTPTEKKTIPEMKMPGSTKSSDKELQEADMKPKEVEVMRLPGTPEPVGDKVLGDGKNSDIIPEIRLPGAPKSSTEKNEYPEQKIAFEDGGADLFRKIYKQTMTANFGLFMDQRV